jgi:protein required for attachment to host cells
MNQNCVVVAGGTRARFFTLEQPQYPEMESGPNLREVNDLINPEGEMHDNQLWSDTKSGRNRGKGGAAHGYDDHRTQHEDEFDRRFVRTIAREAADLARASSAQNLVLVAQKRILGMLRNELDPLIKSGIAIQELAKDLTKLPALELQAHLAREALVPARKTPAA